MRTYIPPGYARVKIMRPVDYARETLAAGQLAVVDDETAVRWVREKRAVPVEPEPERPMIRTTCPRCGSAMEYPEVPAKGEEWTMCLNAKCGFGWLRYA